MLYVAHALAGLNAKGIENDSYHFVRNSLRKLLLRENFRARDYMYNCFCNLSSSGSGPGCSKAG